MRRWLSEIVWLALGAAVLVLAAVAVAVLAIWTPVLVPLAVVLALAAIAVAILNRG